MSRHGVETRRTLSQEDLQAALQRSTNTTQAPVGMLRSRRTKSAVGSGWTGDAGCSTERTKHRCALAKSACVQLLAWQCMICTSAAVFYTSESATQNVLFLFHVYGYLGVKPPRVLVCDTSVPLSPLPSSSPAFHLFLGKLHQISRFPGILVVAPSTPEPRDLRS